MVWISGYYNTETKQRSNIQHQGLGAVVLAAPSASIAAFLDAWISLLSIVVAAGEAAASGVATTGFGASSFEQPKTAKRSTNAAIVFIFSLSSR